MGVLYRLSLSEHLRAHCAKAWFCFLLAILEFFFASKPFFCSRSTGGRFFIVFHSICFSFPLLAFVFSLRGRPRPSFVSSFCSRLTGGLVFIVFHSICFSFPLSAFCFRSTVPVGEAASCRLRALSLLFRLPYIYIRKAGGAAGGNSPTSNIFGCAGNFCAVYLFAARCYGIMAAWMLSCARSARARRAKSLPPFTRC